MEAEGDTEAAVMLEVTAEVIEEVTMAVAAAEVTAVAEVVMAVEEVMGIEAAEVAEAAAAEDMVVIHKVEVIAVLSIHICVCIFKLCCESNFCECIINFVIVY